MNLLKIVIIALICYACPVDVYADSFNFHTESSETMKERIAAITPEEIEQLDEVGLFDLFDVVPSRYYGVTSIVVWKHWDEIEAIHEELETKLIALDAQDALKITRAFYLQVLWELHEYGRELTYGAF